MKFLKVLFFTLFFSSAFAQQTETYTDSWFLLLNHYKINTHWSIGNELHFRMTDVITTKEQLLIRPFVTFSANETVHYSLGYSYIVSYPYTDNAIPHPKLEHNVWEQVQLKHQSKNIKFGHRFRLEQRFQSRLMTQDNINYEIDGFSFSNRFRYRFTMKIPLNDKLYFHLFDELWIRMNKNFQGATYDRNWAYLGFGWKFIPQSAVEIAYLHQNVNKGSDLYEMHPTMQLTFKYDFE